jgi:hypothetical protein
MHTGSLSAIKRRCSTERPAQGAKTEKKKPRRITPKGPSLRPFAQLLALVTSLAKHFAMLLLAHALATLLDD